MTAPTATQAQRLPDEAESVPAQAVDLGFQCGYLLRLGAALVVGALAAGALAYALLASDLGGYAESMSVVNGVRRWVAGAAIVSGLIQIAATGAVVALLALHASHRIAGPATRLVNLLGAVKGGRLPGSVHFRRGDQVGRLAGQFNGVGAQLVRRHERLMRRLEAVRAAADAVRQAAPEEREAAAAEVQRQARELAELLAAAAGEQEGHASC
ncbi:MAG: hypothetical protein ACOC8D_00145 [bacterium]